ncbi:TetR/AcrR family transcriptional regulator [Nocardia paucivorans]|uniref:TetR/AcrR family transcriptional regulator n=1 Tax=Nocardia paucivorans TaxID=114259 RepID=UPI00030F9346|nr:TetR/AcrR family transcriptional regulator [Nocardia paucivorans]
MGSRQTSNDEAGPTTGESRRPRRSSAEVERAVLDAAVDELRERGYEGFTMDRVAARAGTNKTVIYRRWPSRTALAFAAYKQMVARPEAIPNTGDLRSDVIELLRAAADRVRSPVGASIVHGLMADAQHEPELLAGLRREFTQTEPGIMSTILARAVARGEARPESLIPRIATVPIALLRNELTMNVGVPVTDETITEIVDLVFLPLVRANRHHPGPGWP